MIAGGPELLIVLSILLFAVWMILSAVQQLRKGRHESEGSSLSKRIKAAASLVFGIFILIGLLVSMAGTMPGNAS